MKRREFITLLGGAGAAWPLGSRLEGAERLRRIVFLHGISENDPEAGARIVAFRQGLATFGWTENRNVQIEHRFAGGDFSLPTQPSREVDSLLNDYGVAYSTNAATWGRKPAGGFNWTDAAWSSACKK